MELRRAAISVDRARDLGAFGLQNVGDDDAPAVAAEHFRRGASDADPGAGDENGFHSITSPELGPSVWPT